MLINNIRLRPIIFLLLSIVSIHSTAKSVQIISYDTTYNAVLTTPNQNIKQPTLILVHGALSHNQTPFIAGLANLLNEKGYNTLAINLSLRINNRLSRDYKCSSAQHHLFSDAIHEIALWTKWLSAKGTRKIWLMGYGLGANQAALYLTQYKHHKFKGAILVAPLAQSMLIREYEQHSSINNLLSSTHKSKPTTMLPNAALFHCKKSQVSAASFLSYYQDNPQFNVPYLINKITSPLLIIAAEKDSHTDELANKIATFHPYNKKLTFKVIANASADFRGLYIMDLFKPIKTFIN